jgi:hypothetical protein
MTKMLYVAKKRPEITEDEFMTYLRDVQAPLAGRVPRYSPFDTQAALQEPAASSEGRAVLAGLGRMCAPGSGAFVATEST